MNKGRREIVGGIWRGRGVGYTVQDSGEPEPVSPAGTNIYVLYHNNLVIPPGSLAPVFCPKVSTSIYNIFRSDCP